MPESHWRFLIVDGLNVVRRIHEANPAPESPDKGAMTLRNSLGSIRRLLREVQPTHMLLAFDAPGPNWRHEAVPGYDKERKPMPTSLAAVMPQLYDELRLAGYMLIAPVNVEADDTIATAALRARARGIDTVICSTDKDLTVLLAQGARIRDHFSSTWRDLDWCMAKFGVTPQKIPDLLALWGDKVDGIAGVPGVGAKTAAKLLNEYGLLEDVLEAAAAGRIGGKLQAALVNHREQARTARILTSLKTDVALPSWTWRDLQLPST